MWTGQVRLVCPVLLLLAGLAGGKVLTPPYINIAENSKVEATYTCGDGIDGTELYCKLVGANQEQNVESSDVNIIQGQVCDVCNASDPSKTHPPSAAVDGSESYWMSPPLSRGMEYSQVNFTIDLGQEFHVAYVIIKMGISPKPGVWILEKSSDNGATYTPWQYFADTDADCERLFGKDTLRPITLDDSVICDTRYSKILPLEDGEIVVSLLNDRPSAHDFFNSSVLQEWTRATNVRLRLLQTKTLFAHVMSFARQDPSVTRRYFYSIRDINIGGRCRCNGHADTCLSVDGSFKRVCDCKHNTTGINCERCKDNLVQKKWRQSKSYKVFECEECNCHGHSYECVYNETVDALGLSLDKYGKYEGGGVCKNCQDYTEGINCERCIYGYFRPAGRPHTDRNACEPCRCNEPFHTGDCADETGVCECKENFNPPLCDSCAYGYFGFPTCKNCTCFISGTIGGVCEPDNQIETCHCKNNFAGVDCRSCNKGYYNFPECKRCDCHPLGSLNDTCDVTSGQCECRNNYGSLKCDQCANGFYDFPQCTFCKCDPQGTLEEVCDKTNGECLCKPGFGGKQCDKCLPGYKDYPLCQPCDCSPEGSSTKVCDVSGKCSCLEKFSGKTCSQCAFGYYKYPECLPCNCETLGTVKNAQSCDDNAQCKCRDGIEGRRCDTCKEGLYNFPTCEECNCDPAGVLPNSTDCGELSKVGELCQCKSRVMGRTCKECKPLYWNLQHYNPAGCEECTCDPAGVVSGISVCDTKTGQCLCKQNVMDRQCNTCIDGTYKLAESDMFGCTECSCDIGGALDNSCAKDTGACACRPRITGRTCNMPMLQHYFPTLHQFKYELEDGTTPDNRPLSYGYEDSVFPGYSWRGYAIFTYAQNKIRKQVELENSDILNYIVMRYVNRNDETVPGVILARHEDQEPIELKIYFKRTIQPDFAFATGAGNIPHPLIANVHGKWDLEITVNQSLFIDYLVLIPQSFYEGNILLDAVDDPCIRGSKRDCKQYIFPSVDSFDIVYGDSAFVVTDGAREEITDFMEDWDHPMGGSKIAQLPEISTASPELRFDLRVRRKETTFFVIDYATPAASNSTAIITVDIEGDSEKYSTNVKLSPCPFTWLCRHALLDHSGKLATFNISEDFVTVIFSLENEASVGIESVSLVPYNPSTAYEYLKQSPVGVVRNGENKPSLFETPVDVKKIEFESGNEERKSANLPPQILDKTAALIFLDKDDRMVDLAGKVPTPGNYTFIVHYYQPNHPAFNLDAVIHNGYSYEGILPLVHCPSSSGCRSVIRRNDGNNIYLTENFLLTLKAPEDQSVWLDYVLVLPDSKFSHHLTSDKQGGNIDRFVDECSNNFFYADEKTSEFCRSSIFSLTTHYNNGALRCECHPDGVYSLQCEPFGGQCKCKENIIGRRCERCKTGYYNFPYCYPCQCHENSLCDEATGQCSCPPNVVGENCDQCANNTFGYFPQLGCRECECNLLGLQDGNLQCDSTFGTCNCKENVVGRQCDSCSAGYYGFPECLKCDCDLRGTTYEICDNSTGQCLCKENVEAEGCDICREGSFNIQAGNRQGCTKCFCFDHSQQCSSSRLYKSLIENMENWNISAITVKKPVIEISSLGSAPDVPNDPDSLGIDFSLDENLQNKNIYFSAPSEYLGNRLTSYGGLLSYTIFTTSSSSYELMEPAPELILVGANFHLLYFSNELPAAAEPSPISTEITESKFILSNNFLPATRAQLMQVLKDLKAIYIKATYWKQSSTTRLSGVLLDSASNEFSERGQAFSVESCFCEPQYTGLSCEECAPGYYRSQLGQYGGNCVPCQCHGHAASCDQQTGICIDCQHNTRGDHCEMCAIGYHGEARIGTPYDCIICACPSPYPSNNFAISCEISEDESQISCDCKEGYYGSRCQSCAVGFYGDPTKDGDGECRPCDCSGNIDPSVNGSCDSLTGECLQCLHNTFGEACGLCKPGYFGDAVYSKNCQSCVCDTCGTRRCDDKTGLCECQPNVSGERCDKCFPDHYGLHSCQGCSPCECGLASESSQCDVETGNCKCKPGVTGRTCDRCEHGYWNYTSEGCTQCSCNIGYSIGVGCNPATGECECLPGVIGEKCDHCPHRWVLKPSEGCLVCDKCIDDVLDTMDGIHSKFGPFAADFKSFNESFFTRQRVVFINQTVNNLRPNISDLDNLEIDFVPIKNNLHSVVDDVDKLTRKVEYIVDKTNSSMDANLLTEYKNTDDIVDEALAKAKKSVHEVLEIAESFKNGGGAKLGYTGSEFNNDLKEAQDILDELKNLKLQYTEDKIREKELARAEALLQEIKKVKEPVDNRAAAIANVSERIKSLDLKIGDLKVNSLESLEKSNKLQEQIKKYRELSIPEKFKVISTLEGVCNETLKESDLIIQSTVQLLANASTNLRQQLLDNQTEWEDLHDQAAQKIGLIKNDKEALREDVQRAIMKGMELEEQGNELKRLQSEYQHDTNAVQANKNIVHTLRDALITADEAKRIAENASDTSQGIGNDTIKSKDKSTSLKNAAFDTLQQSEQDLKPQLANAEREIEKLTIMKDDMAADLDLFESTLVKARDGMSAPNTDSISGAEEAKLAAAEVQNRIRGIVEELPDKIVMAKQIRTNAKDGEAAISEADSAINNVHKILPNVAELAEKLSGRPTEIKNEGIKLKNKLEDLKTQINRARELANSIKVGITMYPNATLQLRNPPDLPEQGINNKVSVYFNATKPNGLIFFLGNEAHENQRKRSVKTGDFMALEIENGNPKLTVDLGSGSTNLICDIYVADSNWYFAKIERTGKSLRLSVTRVVDEETCQKETVMSGNTAVLNLDKKHSKLFAGGLPTHFNAPRVLNYNTFVGRLEELKIDDQDIGFWNFQEAENLQPSKERDVKKTMGTLTGFRFNGDGFVVLNSTGWQLRKKSEILFRFRTFAKEGLMFLAPNLPSFLSVELRDGRVLFQFDLGSGLLALYTPTTYNDGEWHSVEATRYENQGSLKVDGKNIDRSQSPGDSKLFETPEKVFMGGFPREHNIQQVVETDFDGCIDEVQIDGQSVDLSKNLEVAGVIPGCPPKFASVVSFEPGVRGYVMYPNASGHHNTMELILRFKTSSPDGLLAFADYGEVSASLSLSGGQLIFRVGEEDSVKSESTTGYNDSAWHVVMVTYDSTSLQIYIDDYETHSSLKPPAPVRMLHGQLYFGGVPAKVNAEAAISKHFSGCISDATLNGVIINFGNLTEIPDAIIGKCVEKIRSQPAHRPPTLPPPLIPAVELTTLPSVVHATTPEPVDSGKNIVPLIERPDHSPDCKVPLYPASPVQEPDVAAYRIGIAAGSRIEYPSSKIKQKFNFSIDVRTGASDGLIFYVSDQRHVDFVAVYIHEGQVHYRFNCGSGPSDISSTVKINDKKWHTVKFSRVGQTGTLIVDDQVYQGTSTGSAKSITVETPFYIGGIDPRPHLNSHELLNHVIYNVKGINNSLDGCVREFRLNNQKLDKPSNKVHATACDTEYDQVYFSPDGGYVKLVDKFKIGKRFEVVMEIRARALSGLLLSVHSREAFFVLELVNGSVQMTVDTGSGEIISIVRPPGNQHHLLCDGQWHRILGVKAINVLTTAIDTTFSDPSFKPMKKSLDTKHTLYLGGHPNIKHIRGVTTRSNFVGCIRNIVIRAQEETIQPENIVGNVTGGVCPD